MCRHTIAARALCTLEFAPGTFSTATRSDARLTVTRGAHVLRTTALALTNHGTVVRQGLGRLPRGRYMLAITTGRGRQSQTVLRLAFRVR
jgi:hypothetical protein